MHWLENVKSVIKMNSDYWLGNQKNIIVDKFKQLE